MPWVIRKENDTWAVYKEGPDGEPVGDALGTHASEAEAKEQMAALYAGEPGAKAVKFSGESETEIEGLLAPDGGPFNGRDVQGEHFSAKTDFCLDWFGERPLLYHHGLDPEVGTAVVGRIKAVERGDLGLWMKAQLDKGSKYYEAIRELIRKGALQLSSGAMSHLAQVSKSGEILRWPLVEGTLTPTPANPLATVDFATAKAHFKAIDVEIPGHLAPDPEPATLKALSGSYEELIDRLSAAINPHNPFDSGERYAFVMATFPDHFIARLHEHGEVMTYRCAYTIEEDGTIRLGKMTEVEETYVAKATVAGLVPERLAEHGELVSAYAAALAQRTKDLSERRVKEGRILSPANRQRLGRCLDTLQLAGDEMRALLDSTDPAAVEAKADLGRLLDDIELFELETAV
jgi:hypothetical protein